jgi:hypothetical protein
MNSGELFDLNFNQKIHDQLIHIFYSIFDNNPKWKLKDLNFMTDFLHDYHQRYIRSQFLNLKDYFNFFKDIYENDKMFKEIVLDSNKYSKLRLSDFTPY